MNFQDILGVASTLISRFGVPTAKPEFVATPAGTGKATLVRDGYRLERLDAGQRHKRAHVFDDLESFATWLRHQVDVLGYDDTQVEVLVDHDSVTALLEPGELHGDRVTCQLVPHPTFSAWCFAFGGTGGAACRPMMFNQKGLFGFVRGVQDSITGPGSFDGAILAGEISKIRVKKGAELTSEIDGRGLLTVRSRDENTNVESKIPAEITVTTPIFTGVRKVFTGDGDANAMEVDATYEFDVLVSLDAEGCEPVFQLACPELSLLMHQARRDAVTFLRYLLGEKFRVCLGKASVESVPAHIEWDD